MKNTDGHLGPICNNCGGYGFTNLINGGSGGCIRCQGEGVEPVNVRELANKVDRILSLLEKKNKKKRRKK